MNRKEILQSIKKLHFPEGEYIIVGSGPMVVHWIKESNDIDIVVSKNLFETCKKQLREVLPRTYPDKLGQIYLRRGRVELYLDVNCGNVNPTLKELLARADILEGIAFASLDDTCKFKRAYNKPKHIKDVENILHYIETRQARTTIRPCNANDCLWVVKLLQQLWPKRACVIKDAKNTFNDALKSANQFYFCSVQKDDIVWFGSFNIKNWLYAMGKVAILDELIVDEQHRKTWIAKELLDQMIVFAKKKKCVCIELECGAERKPAHAFYEKYWFEKWNGYFFSMDLV